MPVVRITTEFLQALSTAINHEPSLRPHTCKLAEQLALFLLNADHERELKERERKQKEWR